MEREPETKWNQDKYRWVTYTHPTFLEVYNNRRFYSKVCHEALDYFLDCWIRDVLHHSPGVSPSPFSLQELTEDKDNFLPGPGPLQRQYAKKKKKPRVKPTARSFMQ